MSRNPDIRFSGRTAARLLDGSQAARAAVPGVGEVLSALTAPATESELVGEHAAVSMFTHASLTAPTPNRSPSMIKSTISKLLAAKVLAVGAAAAAATGGIALAASTGVISNPLAQSHVATASTGTATASDTATDTPTATDSPTDTPTDTATATDTATGSPTAMPSPSLTGLCHAYQAGATSNQGKALASPAFSALVSAAGGSSNVGSFCITLIGAPTAHPTGAPTAHPTGAPTAHPTGAPSSHPTGAPSSHPTGAPTSAPTTHSTSAPSSHPTGR